MICFLFCALSLLAWVKPAWSTETLFLSGRKAIAPQGTAGIDYPTYSDVPQTEFKCEQQEVIGYYADVESQCQAFHICMIDGSEASFLCPNETLFHQRLMVCDWWYNVNCTEAPDYYPVNSRIYNNTRILSSNQGFRPENPEDGPVTSSESPSSSTKAEEEEEEDEEDEDEEDASPSRDRPSLDWVPANEDFEQPDEVNTPKPHLGGPKPMAGGGRRNPSSPKQQRQLIPRKPVHLVRPVPLHHEDHFF